MMHGKAIWKLGIGEIAKASSDILPWTPQAGFTAPQMNTQLQGSNELMHHVGLWPMVIKLNPSWKREVSKSAWIKPWWFGQIFLKRYTSTSTTGESSNCSDTVREAKRSLEIYIIC